MCARRARRRPRGRRSCGPKSFIGPERLGVFAMLYEWAREGRDFPILGRGDNRYQLLDVEDLCTAIVARGDAAAPTRANDTFNIGAAEFTTLREDFQAVLDAAGHGGRIRSIPIAPALWALRALERVEAVAAVSVDLRDRHRGLVRLDRQGARAARLGSRGTRTRPRWSATIDWYCANVDRLGAAGVTHRVPWKQGALALAKLAFRPRA